MFVQKSSFKRCLATTRVNEKQFVRKKVSRFLDDSQLLRSSDLHLLNFSVTKYHKLSNGHKKYFTSAVFTVCRSALLIIKTGKINKINI